VFKEKRKKDKRVYNIVFEEREEKLELN